MLPSGDAEPEVKLLQQATELAAQKPADVGAVEAAVADAVKLAAQQGLRVRIELLSQLSASDLLRFMPAAAVAGLDEHWRDPALARSLLATASQATAVFAAQRTEIRELRGDLATKTRELDEARRRVGEVEARLEVLQPQQAALQQRERERKWEQERGREGEEERGRIVRTGVYDMVACIDDVRQVFEKDGWHVRLEGNAARFVGVKLLCTKVSVLGSFNAGKTFLLARIVGRQMELPSGTSVHTEGISVKLVNVCAEGHGEHHMLIIDTLGRNSPAKEPPQGMDLPELLHLQKSLEEIMKQVVLSTTDVFLYVVNQLSATDQLELFLLYQALAARKRNTGRAQRILVVHNLQTWSFATLTDEKYHDRIMRIFTMTAPVKCELHKEGGGDMTWLTGHIANSDGENSIGIQHYFLTNEFTDDCRNDRVYERLRGALVAGAAAQSVDLCQELAESFTQCLPSQVMLPRGELTSVDFKVNEAKTEGRFVASTTQPVSVTEVTPRNRSLGGSLLVASEELAFNISEAPFEFKVRETRGGKVVRCTKQNEIRLVNIEAPGLAFDSLRCCLATCDQEPVLREDGDNVLRVIAHPQGTIVRLDATLHDTTTWSGKAQAAAPAAGVEEVVEEEDVDEEASDDAAKAGAGGVMWVDLQKRDAIASVLPALEGVRLSTDSMAPSVVDAGTRATKEHSSSRVVRLRRHLTEGELKWDRNVSPVVLYRDGILSIAFILNRVRPKVVEPPAAGPPPTAPTTPNKVKTLAPGWD